MRRYAFLLSLLGLAQVALAFAYGAGSNAATGWIAGALLGYSGVSFLAVGCAYAGLGVRVFGKRPQGTLSAWNVALLAPYLALTWLLWSLDVQLRRRAPAAAEILPGLALGRRMAAAAHLPAGTTLVVDMTCEFPEPASIRTGRTYLSTPALDTDVPSDEALRRTITAICEHLREERGGVFVHCASGYGRSATVVAGVLLAHSAVRTAEEAEVRLRALRPGVRLSPAQRAALQRLFTDASDFSRPDA